MKSSGTNQPKQKSEIARVNRRKYTFCSIDTHFGGIGFIEMAHSEKGFSKDVQLSPSKSSHTLQFGHIIVGFLSTEDWKTRILGGWG